MARIPGAPSGNRYGASELRSKKFACGCYPGQTVTISRGLPKNCEPSRVTVVNEYENLIVFKLEFDQTDWEGHTSTSSWNYTISKSDLLCGDAVVKDITDRTIRPSEVNDRPKRRRDDEGRDGERNERRDGRRNDRYHDDRNRDDRRGGYRDEYRNGRRNDRWDDRRGNRQDDRRGDRHNDSDDILTHWNGDLGSFSFDPLI